MSNREITLLLNDMLEAIKNIQEYTQGMSYDSFLADKKTRDAVYHNLEVMGEAANKFPDHFIHKNNHIPWSKIIGTRNNIIHGYFGIDDKIIWNIIQNSLPELKSQIEKLDI